jgi:shikimate kinase
VTTTPTADKPNVVLIGPTGAGKTTLLPLVAERTGLIPIELDDVRWEHYAELGYDHEHANRLRDDVGMHAMFSYWKPFEAASVERVLAEHPSGHVIGFGGGQSVYDEENADLFDRVQRALADSIVVLLLPYADVEKSWDVLAARVRTTIRDHLSPEQLETFVGVVRWMLDNPSNARLATHVAHTGDATPEATAGEIAALVDAAGRL